MTQEIELKRSLPPAQASRHGRNPLLRSLARRRAVTRRLSSVYFDTPDLKLAAHGMALRVRQIGGKRIQTLKLPVDFDSGLQIHREIEFEIDGERSEEHTSELQSLMRISYAGFCLKKKKTT